MFDVFNIAASGMRAAQLRAEAAAHNIATSGTGAPRQTVDQAALPGGGVEAKLRTISPSEGTGAADPLRDFSNLVAARMDFAANAMVARVASDMVEQLYKVLGDDHRECRSACRRR